MAHPLRSKNHGSRVTPSDIELWAHPSGVPPGGWGGKGGKQRLFRPPVCWALHASPYMIPSVVLLSELRELRLREGNLLKSHTASLPTTLATWPRPLMPATVSYGNKGQLVPCWGPGRKQDWLREPCVGPGSGGPPPVSWTCCRECL